MSFLILSTLVVVLAGLHVSKALDSKVDCFKSGVGKSYAVARFTAPFKGRVIVDLMDGEGGILLHMSYRFETTVLVLNAKPAGGSWGTEDRVNIHFATPGDYFQLYVKSILGKFVIDINNGEQMALFWHRLPVESMKEMRFYSTPGAHSKLVELICNF